MVDFCVNAAHQRGINVLMTLWMTPAWANGGRGNLVPPTNPADYADFARWAAEYWKGRVNAWEVWNEPDPNQTYWQGTVSQYVDLLKAAYPKFKAGDPNAPVVLGGPSSNDDAWIESARTLSYAAVFAGGLCLARIAPRSGGAVLTGIVLAALAAAGIEAPSLSAWAYGDVTWSQPA